MKQADDQMMEGIVKSAVQLYKHHGLVKHFDSDTQARDFFLFTFFCSLYQNKQGEASIAIKHESNTAKKWYKRLLDTQSQSRESSAIFQLLSLYIDKISPLDSIYFSEDLNELANDFKILAQSQDISSLFARNKVTVFERVLLRLQAMNVSDHFSNDFDYQELPDTFAKLFCEAELTDNESRSLYLPFETRCELGRYIAAHYPNAKLRIECVGQGAHHLLCMFALLNAQYINLTQSHALSQKPNVEKGQFDIALALLQPTLNTNNKNKKNDREDRGEPLKGFFDKARIDVDSFSSRYKEHGYIQHALWSLKENGKAYFYTGKGPLFRQYERQARVNLIENNRIEAICTLPEKLANFILPTMNLIILDKNKKTQSVRFIDFSAALKSDNDIRDLVSIIHSNTLQSRNVISVNCQQLLLKDANLTLDTYKNVLFNSSQCKDLEKEREELIASLKDIEKSLTDSIKMMKSM